MLSLFPGLDVLGRGFEEEDWCVVRGPDVLWGEDVRGWQVVPGPWDGVIGGPPCQAFSRLSNLVRAKGLEPRFGNLIPEFSRLVAQAKPSWFLMENVREAPDPEVEGYTWTSFLIDNAALGEAQIRVRKFWFGHPEHRGRAPNLWQWIETPALELQETATAVAGNDGSIKSGRMAGAENTVCGDPRRIKNPSVSGSAPCAHRGHRGAGERRTLGQMLELQGLATDLLDEAPFTMSAKRRLVGNAVPLSLAKALARAIDGYYGRPTEREGSDHVQGDRPKSRIS